MKDLIPEIIVQQFIPFLRKQSGIMAGSVMYLLGWGSLASNVSEFGSPPAICRSLTGHEVERRYRDSVAM